MSNAENVPPQKIELDALKLTIELESIFMPRARKRRDEFYNRNPVSGSVAGSARFVHYTSAEAALKIISTKRMWMRNAMSMTDYREVRHGFGILNSFFKNESKKNAFIHALNECAPNAATQAIDSLYREWPTILQHTYITSVSEHLPAEDLHGRLSMWRAFGSNSNARVAFILNIPWGFGGAAALRLIFSPVTYMNRKQAQDAMEEVIDNVHANREWLRSLNRVTLIGEVFMMLLVHVTCFKHEGFHEEREWRAIYSPHLFSSSPQRFSSPLMKCANEVVGGIPQNIYRIPLDQTVDPALEDLEFSRLFDRLIIGPSSYAKPMVEAFTTALIEAGVPKETAQKQVRISGIPIRV